LDSDQDFEWGVWVSVSEPNFKRISEIWEDEGREEEPAIFGWLSSMLPIYTPTTLGLKTMLHTQPVGLRPLIDLEPTDHPLATEQRAGIDLRHVQEIAEHVRHGT
jgi:hypothetical protein